MYVVHIFDTGTPTLRAYDVEKRFVCESDGVKLHVAYPGQHMTRNLGESTLSVSSVYAYDYRIRVVVKIVFGK